jgi:hypothetical protein
MAEISIVGPAELITDLMGRYATEPATAAGG